MSTNYASELGIKNKWAPILFAIMYALLFVWYIAQAIRRHAPIYGGLAFFALLRFIAFSLRSAMANRHQDATNKSMAIAFAIIYNVGFFGLLLSAYHLLNDRERLARLDQARNRFHKGVHKGHLVHILLTLAVILGIAGLVMAFEGKHAGAGRGLNSASTYIFLAVAVIIAVLTAMLIALERKMRGRHSTNNGTNSTNGTYANNGSPTNNTHTPIGASHHIAILSLLATLLLLRSLFYAVTVHERSRGRILLTGPRSLTSTHQYNEHLWYPLAALAELLAAMCFLLPGLVPLRSLVASHRRNRHGSAGYGEKGYAGNNTTTTGQGEYAGNGNQYGTTGTGTGTHAHNAPLANNAGGPGMAGTGAGAGTGGGFAGKNARTV